LGQNPNNRRLRISSKTNHNVKEQSQQPKSLLASDQRINPRPRDKKPRPTEAQYRQSQSVATGRVLGRRFGFVKPKNSKKVSNFHFSAEPAQKQGRKI
jgi:hypothetical protein